MERIEFNNLIKTITNIKDIELFILENQDAKKWYEKTYNSNFTTITENTTYGIVFDNVVQFDFKIGKLDNLFKTFITQFISKHLTKIPYLENGDFKYHTKESALRTLQINSNRLGFELCYSTNYGIGVWQILIPKDKLEAMKLKIEILLKSKGIQFKNEYSEARWVYRYLIDGSYLDHNILVDKLRQIKIFV